MNPISNSLLPSPSSNGQGQSRRNSVASDTNPSSRGGVSSAEQKPAQKVAGNPAQGSVDAVAIEQAFEQRQAVGIRRVPTTLASELLASMLEEMGGLTLADPAGRYIDVYV